MSVWPDWINLSLFTAATALYGYLAWKLRPFGENPAGRPGGFTGTSSMAFAMGVLAADMYARSAGGALPRWTVWTFMAAVLVALISLPWLHVEELRAKWRGRPEPPDPARFPSSRWKWVACMATLFALLFIYAYITWQTPYSGTLGMCAAIIAIYSWGAWAWRRWELSVICRIQSRRTLSVPTA